jgi:hypothetical protein
VTVQHAPTVDPNGLPVKVETSRAVKIAGAMYDLETAVVELLGRARRDGGRLG